MKDSKLKKIWSKVESIASSVVKWADGKKTYIGFGLHGIWAGFNAINKDFTTIEGQLQVHAYIGTITGTGIIHKIAKWWTKLKKR